MNILKILTGKKAKVATDATGIATDATGNELTVQVGVEGLDDFLDAMQQIETALERITEKCDSVCEKITITSNYNMIVRSDADNSVPGSEEQAQIQ